MLRDLAKSIGPNAKGDALVAALPRILDQIVDKRGARKAVIFTELVRTQRYLRDLLDARGFSGRIALSMAPTPIPKAEPFMRLGGRR